MRREVPAAAEGYSGLGLSNTLEFFKEAARDAATSEFFRDTELHNPEATLARRIEQVPNEPVAANPGAEDASPPKVFG